MKVLTAALDTLVIVDKPTSIPLLSCQAALKLADGAAQKADEKEKAGASTKLAAATVALRRGEALGDSDDKSAKHFQKQNDDLERRSRARGHQLGVRQAAQRGRLVAQEAGAGRNPATASKP